MMDGWYGVTKKLDGYDACVRHHGDKVSSEGLSHRQIMECMQNSA